MSSGIVIVRNWFEEVWDWFRPESLITTPTAITTISCPYKEEEDECDMTHGLEISEGDKT